MAADARRRGRLVVHAIFVTAEARRAIALRRGLVRDVARGARRVLRDAMQSAQRRGGVARRARRWRRDAGRPVRAMTGRAREIVAVMLVGVARRAARDGMLRIVRL